MTSGTSQATTAPAAPAASATTAPATTAPATTAPATATTATTAAVITSITLATAPTAVQVTTPASTSANPIPQVATVESSKKTCKAGVPKPTHIRYYPDGVRPFLRSAQREYRFSLFQEGFFPSGEEKSACVAESWAAATEAFKRKHKALEGRDTLLA
jgi:hypothetical protein